MERKTRNTSVAQKSTKKNFINQNKKSIKKLEHDLKEQDEVKVSKQENSSELWKIQKAKKFAHVTSRVIRMQNGTTVENEEGSDGDMTDLSKSLGDMKMNTECQTKPTVPLTYQKGVVPQYIIKRKEEMAKEKEKVKEMAAKEGIPDGYCILTEQEKTHAKTLLQQEYDRMLSEMRRLPIAEDTLRVKAKRTAYEEELSRIEQEMKEYYRPVVYAKLD